MSKKLKYDLDNETADRMLTNIFNELELERSDVPLEVMTSYTAYRRERFSMQKALVMVILILFALLPVMFISPRITVTPDPAATGVPVYMIRLDNRFPVSYITASSEKFGYAVKDLGGRCYSVSPMANGPMTVKVMFMNGQYNEVTVDVNDVDTETPVYLSSTLEDGLLRVYAEDEGSGIDPSGCYALGSTGEKLLPESFDEATGCFIFRDPGSSVNIYIPDRYGNTLHMVLSFK